MPTLLNTGTKDTPLKFAQQLSQIVNQEWENRSFIEKVTVGGDTDLLSCKNCNGYRKNFCT